MRKQMLALVMALMLLLTLAACGGTSEALTEEEYRQAAMGLSEELAAVQTEAAGLSPDDVDGAKALLEDLKKPFNDFMNITPPESYAEAHELLQSGCAAMIDFLDTTGGLLEETDETKLQEGTAALMESLGTAMTDLSEGAAMLDS